MTPYHISRLIGEARAVIATEPGDPLKALILLVDIAEYLHLNQLNALPATLAGDDDAVLEDER